MDKTHNMKKTYYLERVKHQIRIFDGNPAISRQRPAAFRPRFTTGLAFLHKKLSHRLT